MNNKPYKLGDYTTYEFEDALGYPFVIESLPYVMHDKYDKKITIVKLIHQYDIYTDEFLFVDSEGLLYDEFELYITLDLKHQHYIQQKDNKNSQTSYEISKSGGKTYLTKCQLETCTILLDTARKISNREELKKEFGISDEELDKIESVNNL